MESMRTKPTWSEARPGTRGRQGGQGDLGRAHARAALRPGTGSRQTASLRRSGQGHKGRVAPGQRPLATLFVYSPIAW